MATAVLRTMGVGKANPAPETVQSDMNGGRHGPYEVQGWSYLYPARGSLCPLALALLMSRAVLPSGEEPAPSGVVNAVKCDDEIDGFQSCHDRFPTGCTAAGKYDAYVNLLKNQLIDPSSTEPASFLALKDFEQKDGAVPDALKTGHHED